MQLGGGCSISDACRRGPCYTPLAEAGSASLVWHFPRPWEERSNLNVCLDMWCLWGKLCVGGRALNYSGGMGSMIQISQASPPLEYQETKTVTLDESTPQISPEKQQGLLVSQK